MPVYLRIFYYRKLNEQHKKENEQMEKANKGKGSSSISRPPSYSKP